MVGITLGLTKSQWHRNFVEAPKYSFCKKITVTRCDSAKITVKPTFILYPNNAPLPEKRPCAQGCNMLISLCLIDVEKQNSLPPGHTVFYKIAS
jgi:hypothetical protein